MINFLSSSLLTVILFLFMAAYLVQGKIIGWGFSPKGMIGLASLLMLQGGWAIIYRLLILSRKVSGPACCIRKEKGELLKGTPEKLKGSLRDKGFRQMKLIDDSLCFTKGLRRSYVLELVAYGALVFALLSGLMNYGFGMSGYVNVSPGGEPIDLNKTGLERGFLAGHSEVPLEIKAMELTYAADYKPSVVFIDIADKKDGNMTSYRLETGESISVERLRFRYMGDAYLAYISVMKKRHDYLASPLELRISADNARGLYTGPLIMNQPGAKGEGEFDPETRLFKIKVYKDEELEFDREVLYGDTERQGDLAVTIGALSHYGRIEITRYGYRNLVIVGMIVFMVFLLARFIFRPVHVCLWTEGDKTFFYTCSRSIRKIFIKA
jgi:hypothetical protein